MSWNVRHHVGVGWLVSKQNIVRSDRSDLACEARLKIQIAEVKRSAGPERSIMSSKFVSASLSRWYDTMEILPGEYFYQTSTKLHPTHRTALT
jgi:hypothetical protein